MKKWRKNIFSAIAFASFFLVLGSVGAMERYTISFEQGVMQICVFLICFVCCSYVSGGFKERREG